MQRFFNNFDHLDRFTLSLDSHQDTLVCPHCAKMGQLISHGVIYKQRSSVAREAVGKHILCAKRYGRSGCGRTIQLYVAHILPALQYGANHLFVFLSALLLDLTVDIAYQTATGRSGSRNAWRWLDKLENKLLAFRCFLNRRTEAVWPVFRGRVRRLRLLLPTLQQLFLGCKACPCANYQLDSQMPFL